MVIDERERAARMDENFIVASNIRTANHQYWKELEFIHIKIWTQRDGMAGSLITYSLFVSR